ncbi:hypothetical protein BKA66DRAFT_599359 [Pyrenochaeta sp. MPI-SDFR-AT-0127]|nr:hypothetical protein BKA66DRAFT_599359 [Pyrenochaeta sp. MPI-SDFR-AT-0127]
MLNALFTTIAALNGFGMRSKFLILPEIARANKWTILGQTFHIIGIATSKGAVALFLARIVVERW